MINLLEPLEHGRLPLVSSAICAYVFFLMFLGIVLPQNLSTNAKFSGCPLVSLRNSFGFFPVI